MNENSGSLWGDIEKMGYSKLPVVLPRILDSLGFSAGEKWVVMGVVSCVRNNNLSVSISRKGLEDYSQTVTKTVSRALTKMKELGMKVLVKAKPEEGKCTRYDLTQFISAINTRYRQMEAKRRDHEAEVFREKDKQAVRFAIKEEALSL
jgi:hypothetical protein